MSDASAVEEMLEMVAAANKASSTDPNKEETKIERGRDSKGSPDRKRERSSDRRRRDRSSDRRRGHRDRSSDRSRRDRDRSPDRRRRDSPDRRRRSSDRRSSDRSNRRDRERSRERSPDRKRRDRGGRSPVREKSRERSPEISREEQRRKREIDDLTKDQRTIFISQLTKKVTEKNLEDFFGAIGKVKNIIMLRDRISGAHKGFAYVEMRDLEAIPNCLMFNNVVPDFQKFPILVKASEAEKNFLAKKDTSATSYQPELASGVAGVDPNVPDNRLYVGNIHISIDEPSLRAVLEQFGPLESIKLHRDNLGNSKGFAFVKYLLPDGFAKACVGIPALELLGRQLKIGPVIDNSSAAGMGGMGGTDVSGNWKLDADEGGAGMVLNSTSRMALMAKLGHAAGLAVPSLPTPAVVVPPPAPGIPPIQGAPSTNLLVCNMFDPATETEPDWDQDIREDMLEECSKHGQVEHVYVEKHKPGGIVLLKFAAVEAAVKAASSLNGRFFAGRMITAAFVDANTFSSLML